MHIKAVVLIGGPQKGTRFRPLSLDCPKPLFPVAGVPSVQHHIAKLAQVPGLREILLLGFYQPNQISNFVNECKRRFSNVNIRYLQEFAPLGTAGGIYHFRDQILLGGIDAFFVLNSDVCGDLPLAEMARDLETLSAAVCLMLTTEATREQSINYGCAVVDQNSMEVLHYVEKPTTFLSTSISTGVYIFTPEIFQYLSQVFQLKSSNNYINSIASEAPESMWFENDVFPKLADCKVFYAFHTTKWWSQLKTAAAAIYANRHYLRLYHVTHQERLAQQKEGGPKIIGDVFIHPSAVVSPSAVIGPNVSIGSNVTVATGVRIRESIVLDGAVLQEQCCVLYSVIGWNCHVGEWARVEGTPVGPNPNMPFAKLESKPLFNPNGKLNPSITVIGCNVQIPTGIMVLNSIVLPHKELEVSYMNQIIL